MPRKIAKKERPAPTKKPKPHGKIGRRPAISAEDEDDVIETIRALALLDCTLAEIAAALRIAEVTLQKFFARRPDAREVYEDSRMMGAVSLRRKQFRLADKSAAMGIHLGINRLGQKPSAAFASPSTSGDLGAEVLKTLLREIDSLTRQAEQQRVNSLKTIEGEAVRK